MAETRVTNVIIPEIFTEYTLEPSIYRSRFWASGIMEQNSVISDKLNGGGRTFNFPFWKDTIGSSGDIPSETADQTVNAITADKQIALRQFRTKAWGENDLAAVLAGDSPIESAAKRINDYWGQAYDQIAIKTLQGIIVNNVADDSGDLVNDVSGGTGSASYFSDDGVIDAQAKLGENGTVGRGDQDDYVAILVHPSTYAYMRKLDLIDFVMVSDQTRPVATYMNMRVIVDRNATLLSTVYSSYIIKSGALQMGLGSSGYLPTEVNREPLSGFGIDQLITRRVFAIHPPGFSWIAGTVAGQSPTDAELILTANWDRDYAAENSRIVVLKHKLP